MDGLGGIMRDSMEDRKKGLEEEYFRKREQELIEKLKQRAAERKGLAEAVGVENEEILQTLREMGFDRETVVLLALVPLLQVAWTDGKVTARERDGILEIARSRGVSKGSPAEAKLLSWLDHKPDPTLFERALTVIRHLVSHQAAEFREATSHDLVAACERIASASGGILGMGAVSAEEKAVIQRVAREIQKAHRDAAGRVSESL
jgi:tellurite resistance protein